MVDKELKLKVAEAIQDDVNKGIVRIDSGYLAEVDIKAGDIVEIEGERKTVAIADRSYPGDIGLNIIRMDGIIRKNAKTGIGEIVKIRKALVKEAKKVIIAPARKGIVIRASPEIFKQGLLGRAVVRGDIVSLGGARRRKTTMMNNPFFDEDIFSILDESMMGIGFGDIKFVVVDTNPKQAVIILDSTEIEFRSEAVEIEEERVPDITYEDVGGLEDEIKKVREMVELPLKHPEIFERLGIEAPKGVLLHGPPGTGKTLLAKAVANETNSHFILINGPEIMSKYYGQSEENLRKKFEEAEKNAPSIIFIDEIDAIASKREETRGEVERRVVAQLLALMDGLQSRGKVVVIAATNVPNILDPALRRPGRFDRELEIGVPSKEGRLNILKIHTRNMPIVGELYGDILKKNILLVFDSKIKNIDENINKKTEELENTQLELRELEKQKIRVDHSVLDKILNSIRRTNEKINELSEEIKDIEKDMSSFINIKETLSKNKNILLKLTSEIKEIDDIKYSHSDPRAKIVEKKKSELYEAIESLEKKYMIIKDIMEKSRREGLPRDLEYLGNITHGFVGADLASLAKESAMIVLRNEIEKGDLKELKEDEPLQKELLERLVITQQYFKEALKVVRPSALREVIVEVPNIKWSDIGGLTNVKQELIEAVEWPLKHPEAFKRLGVRPPKGILLFGAPGTGKTLLAKAVANESEANFILVKGPELLCISASTKIFTDFCGARAIENFFEYTKAYSTLEKKSDKIEVRNLTQNVHTIGIDSYGKLVKTKVKRATRILVNEAYKIIFDDNNIIEVSKNQPFFICRNGVINWIKAEDLQLNDFVAKPSSLIGFNKEIKFSLPKYKHLRLVKETKDSYYVKIFSADKITKLPKKLTSELAEFLGWFASEGNISKEQVCICNTSAANRRIIRKLFEIFADEKDIKEDKDKIFVYSTPLVKFLEGIFEMKLAVKKSYIINVPPVITKSFKEVICAFLRGAYKGDGHIDNQKIEYGTMSKYLAQTMIYLLSQLLIKAKYWQRKDKMYLVTISGKKEMNKFLRSVMNSDVKDNDRKYYNAKYLVPDVRDLLRQAKEKLDLHYSKEIPEGLFEGIISGRKRCGLLRLKRMMIYIEKYSTNEFKNSDVYNTLKIIAEGDLSWTKIKNIEIANPQWMYDLETENDSFVGGDLPLILHNSKWVGESEKAVREVFKKARQVSPCIIFFDEVDALAPRRGLSSDSHVSERVVNQLLTEIDGLEDLHDVVVIAATNRPDIVDTALLRPGRFDRMILTLIPNENTRLEIFKVHTKGMPISTEESPIKKRMVTAKTVGKAGESTQIEFEEERASDKEEIKNREEFLKYLAKKTEGYVGADIEAVCREAAILALREDITSREIFKKHFEQALEKVRPSVTKDVENAYEQLQEHFTAARAKQMLDEKPGYMG